MGKMLQIDEIKGWNEPWVYETIKYDWIGAEKAGARGKPIFDVKDLGMKVLFSKYIPLGDFVIMAVDKVPNTLPDYIKKVELTEEDISAFGLP